MKTEQIKKFRIIDKEYLPENVIAINVEEDEDCIIMSHIYDRDGQARVERYSKDKLKLHAAIWDVVK